MISRNVKSGGGYAEIGFGVFKMKIESIEVQKFDNTDKGKGVSYKLTAAIKIGNYTNKFVSLGFFPEMTAEEIKEGIEIYEAFEMLKQNAFDKNKENKEKGLEGTLSADLKELNGLIYDKKKDNQSFKKIMQIVALEEFLANFGESIKEGLAKHTLTTTKGMVEYYASLCKNTQEAYAVLMTSSYVGKNNKVYDNINFTQNYIDPKSWPLYNVVSVEETFEEDNMTKQQVFVGYTVNLKKGKPELIKKTPKSCEPKVVTESNDSHGVDVPYIPEVVEDMPYIPETEETPSLPIVPTADDDLPF